MAVFLLIPITVFAQSSSQDDNCPIGTKPVIKGITIECVKISTVQKTCPDGTYQGKDNQGNFACRDIKTNQIVDPSTGLMYDSQTGEIILNGDQSTYAVIGIAIVFIIVVGIIAVSRKKSEPQIPSSLSRRGWTDSQHKQVLEKQNGRCAICRETSGTFQFDHKDDNRNNNDLDNCQALCPNCHDRKSRHLD